MDWERRWREVTRPPFFKSALTGAVSGAVGGAVGVSAGSPSANAGTAFGGSMAGTAAGTYAGVMFGAAAWGQEPTWQSIGTSFMSAFAGTMASTALSKGWSQLNEESTAGAAAKCKGSGTSGAGSGGADSAKYPDVPQVDKSTMAGAVYGFERRLSLATTQADYDSVVQSAVNFWGIKGLTQPAYYEPNLDYSADTNYSADSGALTMRVGPPGATNARVLLSTVYHEGVHVRQAQTGNWSTKSSLFGSDVNELEAYNSEMALSKQLNLSSTDRQQVIDYRASHWQRVQGTNYESRVISGNYKLMRGDFVR